MLCGLGTAVFAATSAGNRVAAAGFIPAFVAAAFWMRPNRIPDAAWVGTTVAIAAIIGILRPRIKLNSAICSAALAALWAVLLEVQGMPTAAAVALAFAVPAVSMYLTITRPAFAPQVLQEDALLAMFAMGLTVAMIPDIAAGWGSALALNRQEQDTTNQVIATWILVLSAASVVLGGLYALLKRR
jgi:hypothetical protein